MYFISILFFIYDITKFNIFLKLIEIIGGPLFIKILQVFRDFYNLKNSDNNVGSISEITIKDNIVTKTLKSGIKNDLRISLNLLKDILNIKKIRYPFYFSDFDDINYRQLDLNLEKEYSKKLNEIFKNIKKINVINIFESNNYYHKSDLIVGEKIDCFLSKKDNFKFEKEIYSLLYLSYYLMLSSNIFHCDWHFGNFLVTINNDEIILNILDTGLMSELEEDNYTKLKILIRTNMLKPEPINILKFLCSVNKNTNANLNLFILKCKKEIPFLNKNQNYKIILLKFMKFSSEFNLKFPICILYMFQAIIFINSCSSFIIKDLYKFSKEYGFSDEILKYLL